jgi:hypothetical protein
MIVAMTETTPIDHHAAEDESGEFLKLVILFAVSVLAILFVLFFFIGFASKLLLP